MYPAFAKQALIMESHPDFGANKGACHSDTTLDALFYLFQTPPTRSHSTAW